MLCGRFHKAGFVILLALFLAGSFTMVRAQGQPRFKIAGLAVEQGTGEPVVMASVVIKELDVIKGSGFAR